jgi:hypothetical protein
MAVMLMIVFQYSVFTIVVDDFETCEAAQRLNQTYWHQQGIKPRSVCPRSVCVKTFRI